MTVSNNSATITSSAVAVGLGSVDNTGLTVSGNSLSATGGATPNSRAITLRDTAVAAGSTGNINVNGICTTTGTNTGSVSFTDVTTCP